MNTNHLISRSKHHHGINVPLFSLRTQQSGGIGEYPDLLPIIAWCKSIGLDVLQILPLNDTGMETSPYSALSSCALNPIHIGLSRLPHIQENTLLSTILKECQKLNTTQRVDYLKLHAVRTHFLHEYFKEYSDEITLSKDYQLFIENNPWLMGYALFKTLKISGHWQRWDTWPNGLKDPSQDTLKDLYKKFDADIAYHLFLQFLCFQQMQEVKKLADSLGIYLIGDIPILINRESADVWLHRNLFNLELEAGAPPDQYSDEGQNWGFPLYNWEKMAQANYEWWKQRLSVASQLYHIYRIDHIVGFYRIWGIPHGKKATEGQFVPENPALWIEHGDKILRMMLESTPMLPIGEDLGTIPPEVRVNMQKLGICGTKVMRWERNWKGDGSFILPHNYPPLSMTTVSIHDSEPVFLWWLHYPKEAKEYCFWKGWKYMQVLDPEYQFAILYDSHHTASLFHINLLNEYLALFPEMIWPNPKDERINTPGVISPSNWSYRFRPFVEEIIANEPLAVLFKDLIA